MQRRITMARWSDFEKALLMVAVSLRTGPDGRTKSWEWAASWINAEITRRGLLPFRDYTSQLVKGYYYLNKEALVAQWGNDPARPQAYIDNTDATWAQIDPRVPALEQPAPQPAPEEDEPVEGALTP